MVSMAAVVAALISVAVLLTSEGVWVGFTHQALRSRVRALAWELAEAEFNTCRTIEVSARVEPGWRGVQRRKVGEIEG